MSNIRNLMLSAALVGFAALPAAALNIGTGESTMLTVVPPAVSSDATSTDTTASTDTTGTANTDVLSPDNDKFAGSTVVSADGMKVGAVRAVNMNADGSMMVFVDLDQTVTSKAKAFSINLAANTQADGSLQLGWTQAELVAALDAQVQ